MNIEVILGAGGGKRIMNTRVTNVAMEVGLTNTSGWQQNLHRHLLKGNIPLFLFHTETIC